VLRPPKDLDSAHFTFSLRMARMSRRALAAITTVVAVAAICAAAVARTPAADQERGVTSAVIEIRAYTLKTGTRGRFHELFVRRSLPLLQRHHVDVVAYGPSLDDANSYYLVRSFASLDDRSRSEDAFYGSKEWTEGPRDEVLAAIETYSTVVVQVDGQTLQALRGLMPAEVKERRQQGGAMQETTPTAAATASDVATLLALNDDYIRSVQASDANRFGDILGDDFLCSLPDGSLIDRSTFLKQIAAPAKIANLQAHDVNVRVMGDFALVHARTTFTADGRPGAGRYTDAWARRSGRWVAVAAHVTRY
jgi:ketosteroid isomerase-like protein